MEDNSNINILNSIFTNFKRFRSKEITLNEMVANISGNLTALEGTDSDFIDNFYYFIGEMDFIDTTETPSNAYDLAVKEVEKYETYLRSYFNNLLIKKGGL